MLNILVPLASRSPFFPIQDYPFPKPLIEIKGIPMIEYVVSSLSQIQRESRFIFIVNRDDCVQSHLDSSLRLLTRSDTPIFQQPGECAGAVCSCLLAIDEINNDSPLLISNGDQWISQDLNPAFEAFDHDQSDAGVICFESIHPRWSYVRLEKDNRVVETAEKNPISRNAVAGLYYFRKGSDFVEAAQKSILKEAHYQGRYYIGPTLNELVLAGKKITTVKIPNKNYVSFYSPQKIEEFERDPRTLSLRP